MQRYREKTNPANKSSEKNTLIRLSANSTEYQSVSVKLSVIFRQLSVIFSFFDAFSDHFSLRPTPFSPLSYTVSPFVLHRASAALPAGGGVTNFLYFILSPLRPSSPKRNAHLTTVRRLRTKVRVRRTLGLLTAKSTFRSNSRSQMSLQVIAHTLGGYLTDNWRIISC